MKYFVAYTFKVGKENFFRNELLEVDKKVETSEDIRKMEEMIIKKLNGSIRERIVKEVNKKIEEVQILNYKEIEEEKNLKSCGIAEKDKIVLKGNRKKTTIPPEIFETEAQKLNKKVLRLLGKI